MKVIVLIALLVSIVAAAPSANINEDQPTSLQEIESAEQDEETIPDLESVDEEAVQYGFGKSLKKKIKKIGKQIEKVGKEVGKDAIAGVVGGLVG